MFSYIFYRLFILRARQHLFDQKCSKKIEIILKCNLCIHNRCLSQSLSRRISRSSTSFICLLHQRGKFSFLRGLDMPSWAVKWAPPSWHTVIAFIVLQHSSFCFQQNKERRDVNRAGCVLTSLSKNYITIRTHPSLVHQNETNSSYLPKPIHSPSLNTFKLFFSPYIRDCRTYHAYPPRSVAVKYQPVKKRNKKLRHNLMTDPLRTDWHNTDLSL